MIGHNTKLSGKRRRNKSYINQFKEVYGRKPSKPQLRLFIYACKRETRYLG